MPWMAQRLSFNRDHWGWCLTIVDRQVKYLNYMGYVVGYGKINNGVSFFRQYISYSSSFVQKPWHLISI